MADSKDVYSKVTDKIIADLERGNLTWLQLSCSPKFEPEYKVQSLTERG